MYGVTKYPLKSDVSGICKNKLKLNLAAVLHGTTREERVSGQGQGQKKE
jgi:hypothetical protein